MSEEIKINMPLFNINEETELENELSFHLDEFTNEIMRTMSKDRDIVILKKVIEKQRQEIEDLRIIADDIKEHNIIYTDTHEFEDRFISKDKLREILNKYAKTDVKNHVEILNFYRELKELLGEYYE